jgi:hypothetical protein
MGVVLRTAIDEGFPSTHSLFPNHCLTWPLWLKVTRFSAWTISFSDLRLGAERKLHKIANCFSRIYFILPVLAGLAILECPRRLVT